MGANRRTLALTTVPHVDEAPSLEALRGRRSEILEIVRRHGGSNLTVCGPVARGTAGPGSDVDLLVDMEEGSSLLDPAALHVELEDLLSFSVEIATDVKPRLRGRVHDEAVLLSTGIETIARRRPESEEAFTKDEVLTAPVIH